MRIAFLSDIHGNATALDAVLQDIKTKQVDKTVVLGDIAYRGPEPKRSIELVQQLDATVIKGNADEWIVRGVKQGEVPEQALELMTKERDWAVAQLEQSEMDYLANLPTETYFTEQGVNFHGFHATPTSLFANVLPDAKDEEIESTLMGNNDADVYLYGHIHKPYIRYINGKTIMNLGSVGLPFDGLAKASYALVDVNDGNVTTSIQRVDYDLHKTIELYEQVGYPNTEMMQNVIRNGHL
ncbi:metallophosphoesterase family protein [Aquibacillus sediminis]|uniref:metallophosphoesterase family protein n=1 Tax=Aquibacillus sediminis TaxID=2574734 RepID=UPI001108C9F7|nr:YfcE family phosphodiesterase [Aquibacillus sediminis]